MLAPPFSHQPLWQGPCWWLTWVLGRKQVPQPSGDTVLMSAGVQGKSPVHAPESLPSGGASHWRLGNCRVSCASNSHSYCL